MEAKTHPAKSDLAERFERLYYAEVDREELAARSARDLAGAAASHLEFGRRFSSGKPGIRAYNPTPAHDGWHSTHTVVEIINDDMPFLVDSVTMEVNRQGLTLHLSSTRCCGRCETPRASSSPCLRRASPPAAGSSPSCTSRSTAEP